MLKEFNKKILLILFVFGLTINHLDASEKKSDDNSSANRITETIDKNVDDNIYVTLPLTSIINPISIIKKTCCSATKFNEDDIWIRTRLYNGKDKEKISHARMPLSIFKNNDGSFKKKGEKVVYKKLCECKECSYIHHYILTITSDFEEIVEIYYDSFIQTQKQKESTCIIL